MTTTAAPEGTHCTECIAVGDRVPAMTGQPTVAWLSADGVPVDSPEDPALCVGCHEETTRCPCGTRHWDDWGDYVAGDAADKHEALIAR